MKSGKWLLTAAMFFALAMVNTSSDVFAASKDDTPAIYNKAGKKGKGGPISFSGQHSGSGKENPVTDELPFSERNAKQKAELHEKIAQAAYERAEETKRINARIQAENDMRMAQQSQHQTGQGGNTPETKKTYVYNPSGSSKKEETPSIIVTPKNDGEQNEGGSFRVFKFNRNK